LGLRQDIKDLQLSSIVALSNLIELYRPNVEQLLPVNSVGQIIHLAQTFQPEVARLIASVLATDSQKLQDRLILDGWLGLAARTLVFKKCSDNDAQFKTLFGLANLTVDSNQYEVQIVA
jgi:hypothetical protein